MIEYRITCGFIPLTDSLLLVIAREKGFAAAQGVDLTLIREISWANIRDRVAVGQFDVAHMLGPMPIAASLGLSPIDVPVIAPIALGLGGNAVTVSTALWRDMEAAGALPDFDARKVGAALAAVAKSRTGKLKLAVVHPYSSHNYELRYWLAASGIDPSTDVEIVIVPPPLMADALAAGRIDGYCVGEPWNSAGVAAGAGRIATVKAAIWPLSPEKVLGVTSRWAEAHPAALAALIRAIYQAARWCSDPANHAEAARVLAQRAYVGEPAEQIARALSGRIEPAPGAAAVSVEDFFVPHQRGANDPAPAHALWFYSQMVRWGDVVHSADNAKRATASYRPDLYRVALAPLGVTVTASPRETRFFDGGGFDPAQLEDYIAAQAAIA
jgi:ABC-type nitrate/sulfonate/bicarbonate transport system substrate-binding protein